MENVSFTLLRKILLDDYRWTFAMVGDLKKQLEKESEIKHIPYGLCECGEIHELLPKGNK